jgi:hypothetical protein
MVDDLLTTARLDAGALHYQFEHLAVLDEIHEVVEPMRRSGLSVDVDAQPTLVRSDRLRLRQVVRNLLSNAGKYGGPRVRVIGRLVSGWYELRVEDDGEGIPKDLEERLFQRFLHQGDAPLVLGSVGLGLSIVRALAEGMGGAVWYERTSDGWTSFVVRVALAPAGAQAPAYREPGTPARVAEPSGYGDRRAEPIPSLSEGSGGELLPDGFDELPPPSFEPPAQHSGATEGDSLRQLADQLLKDL